MKTQLLRKALKRKREGGPGSGHFGHAGRPGKRGGSAPGKRGLQKRGRTATKAASGAASAYGYELDKTDPDPRDTPDEVLEGRQMSWNEANGIALKVLRKAEPYEKYEKPNDPTVEMYTDWLTYHDPKVASKLRGIVVPENNKEWKTEYKRTFDESIAGVVGFYNRKYDQITVKPRKFEGMQDTFHHEMGHLAWKRSKTKRPWTTNWREDDDFDRHTFYGKINVGEGFAESYMSYISWRAQPEPSWQKLSEDVEFTYLMVEEVIDGVP